MKLILEYGRFVAEYRPINLYIKGQPYAEGWNFGPNDEDARSVKWIVEHMVNSWGNGASWQINCEMNPHEAKFLKLDISKARLRLCWQPRLQLHTALELITSWHLEYLAKGDMKKLCLAQIHQYSSIN